MLQLSLFTGLSCSHIRFYALRRAVTCEAHLPPPLQIRSFSESAMCFASKDNTPKDGSSDGGKVLFCSNTALGINNIDFLDLVYWFAYNFPTVFLFHLLLTVWTSHFPVVLEKCRTLNISGRLDMQLRWFMNLFYVSRRVQQTQLGRDLWVRAGRGKVEVNCVAPDVEIHAHMSRSLGVSAITVLSRSLYLAMH